MLNVRLLSLSVVKFDHTQGMAARTRHRPLRVDALRTGSKPTLGSGSATTLASEARVTVWI